MNHLNDFKRQVDVSHLCQMTKIVNNFNSIRDKPQSLVSTGRMLNAFFGTAEGNGTVSNSTSYFNGRGQVNKSTYQAGTSNHNATSIKYNVMGRQWKVSRPYDTGSSPSDWSEIAYDYLGRATTQTAPDGFVTS